MVLFLNKYNLLRVIILTLLFVFCDSGANSLIQATIPRILCPVEGSADHASLRAFSNRYMGILGENALLVKHAFDDTAALTSVEPRGAMYSMVGINIEFFDPAVIPNDEIFAQMLLKEENLFVLPGKCFSMPNFVRLVMCCPPEMLHDACNRMKAFCARHARR